MFTHVKIDQYNVLFRPNLKGSKNECCDYNFPRFPFTVIWMGSCCLRHFYFVLIGGFYYYYFITCPPKNPPSYLSKTTGTPRIGEPPILEATCLDVKPYVIRPTAFQQRPNCADPPLPDIGFQSQTYVRWIVNIWMKYEKCTVIMTKKRFLYFSTKPCKQDSGLYLKPLKNIEVFLWCKTFVTPYTYILCK